MREPGFYDELRRKLTELEKKKLIGLPIDENGVPCQWDEVDDESLEEGIPYIRQFMIAKMRHIVKAKA